ncbi:hypothetical protein PIB30_118211 [Stylosanthes scabra]|uniref:Uncharacterized protein n=1 Tax=Stylosanthes scabra TaxID=79078 RepID=A0ABU6WIG0_9FABA|nr:hypothetical protein [Stylosanthes scabra]
MEATKPTGRRHSRLRSSRDGGVTVWHHVGRSQGWDGGLTGRNLIRHHRLHLRHRRRNRHATGSRGNAGSHYSPRANTRRWNRRILVCKARRSGASGWIWQRGELRRLRRQRPERGRGGRCEGSSGGDLRRRIGEGGMVLLQRRWRQWRGEQSRIGIRVCGSRRMRYGC